MKRIFFFIIIIFFLLVGFAIAKDVYVKWYYKKNGTYVRPHVRSSPDSYKWNNYGPSKNSFQLMNPTVRDNDNDGTPNYLDKDDDNDNDGIFDDYDNKQYFNNKRYNYNKKNW